MAATDFVTETQIDSLVTNIATAVKANTTALGNHLSDTTDAHGASAISVADVATQLTATDVEAALAEIMDYAQTKTDDSAVTTHIGDASAAHAASAISIVDVAGDYIATDVEAALAEVKVIADAAAGGGATINDATTSLTEVWSSSKTNSEIGTAVSNLVASAPAALDTLDELAAALGDDANYATTVSTALGNRVRVDASQSFTAPQQLQGRQNIGVIASTVDFATAFNTAIA